MDVVIYEEPTCAWCWAFQPAETAFLFEFGHRLRPRRVLGGHPGRPELRSSARREFRARQCRLAAELTGMPMAEVWGENAPRDPARVARWVKAVESCAADLTSDFLRRLREAFFAEGARIDDDAALAALAEEVGAPAGSASAQIHTGRAEQYLEIDRRKAVEAGFGFPTIVVRSDVPDAAAIRLQGNVPYEEWVGAMLDAGFPSAERRRFRDGPADWTRLFGLRRRLTRAEIAQVSGFRGDDLERRIVDLRIERDGDFLRAPAAGFDRLGMRMPADGNTTVRPLEGGAPSLDSAEGGAAQRGSPPAVTSA